MRRNFFIKKYIYQIGCFASVVFVFLSCFYAHTISKVQTVYIGKSFYFLVSKNTHVEAGAYDIALQGGAGYLLEDNGREYVAWGVYLTEHEAQKVEVGLREDTITLQKSVEKLYFKTPKEKNNGVQVKNTLSWLNDCIKILDLETKRLENGATQESSKRILSDMQKQFAFMGKEYKTQDLSFANVCENAANALETICLSTVFVKDLRYLECELCFSYLKLSERFYL